METELATLLRDRNVVVTTEATTSGRPSDFAVLDLDGVVLAAIDLEPLRSLLEDATPTAGGLGFETDGYADVLQYLQEATFTSVDRDRMLQATREIEDRAFRVGHGQLRAGFQTVERLAVERDRYVELADRGLEVAVYATPGDLDVTVPDADVHLVETDEIARHWFVSFDGGGEEQQMCTLLAEEREDGFYGVWTYDPETVDWTQRTLAERYDGQRRRSCNAGSETDT